MALPIKVRKRTVTIVWNAYLTALLFIVGIAVWLAFSFRVQVAGYHIHHFPLGLYAFAVGIFSLIFSGFSMKVTLKAAPLPSTTIRATYVVIPFISSLIYFTLGFVLILTDLPDFLTWLSCPTKFDWTAINPGAGCLP